MKASHTKRCLWGLLAGIAALAWVQSAWAAAPQQLNVQGVLRDTAGQPANGTFNLRFGLYSADIGGTEYWFEIISGVTAANGVFTATLGANAARPLPADLFANVDTIWLGIRVEAEQELPRQRLVSVPYALQANHADAAELAFGLDCAGCVTVGALGFDPATQSELDALRANPLIGLSCSPGYILIFNGTQWTCSGDYLTQAQLAPYVTQTEMDAALAAYVDSDTFETVLSGYVSQDTFDAALAAYVTQSALETALAGYVTQTALQTLLNSYVTQSALQTALSSYVTQSALQTALSSYVTQSALQTALASYVTQSALTTTLSSYVTQNALTTTLASYVTQSALTTTLANYVTQTGLAATLTNYVTQTALTTAIDNLGQTLGQLSCAEGEVPVFDGTEWACDVVVVDLPADGLNEISNNLLTNQFTDSTASNHTPIQIPDGLVGGVVDTLAFPNIGIAQTLNVAVHLTNSDLNHLRVVLTDPSGVSFVLWCGNGVLGFAECTQTSTATEINAIYPPTQTALGNLTSWYNRNPAGTWSLRVIDLADLPGQSYDGQLLAWSVNIQTLSNQKVQVNGNLVINGALTVADDTQGAGKVLVSDANGKATWQNGIVITCSTNQMARFNGTSWVCVNLPSADCSSTQVLTWQGGAFVCRSIGCPTGMADAGGYCIDIDDNPAASWQAQAILCQQEGKRMCSMAEWLGACNARTSLALNNMLDGNFEYVDEYWVMNYYASGNYYSSYVSMGATECGRVYYSGWGCSNSSCYDTTNPGGAYQSRCCK